jgi:hypothetical protein
MKESYVMDINTILHTKDGRKIGNAIITGREGYFWKIKTDYGNEIKQLTTEEVEEMFYIGWEDYTKEIDGHTCQQMQEMMSSDHKHRVEKIKLP